MVELGVAAAIQAGLWVGERHVATAFQNVRAYARRGPRRPGVPEAVMAGLSGRYMIPSWRFGSVDCDCLMKEWSKLILKPMTVTWRRPLTPA